MVNGVVLDWDGREIRTDEFTYKVASLLVKLFKDRLNVANMSAASYGSSTMVNAIKTQVPWETYSSVIDTDLQNFKIRRKPYLLYESRSFR
jgi:hypothetical protein